MAFAGVKTRIGTIMMDVLVPRQFDGNLTDTDRDGFVNESGRFVPFWWSREGMIIKWSIFLGIAVLFGAYLIIGYKHAKRRMRKDLPPLAYHRWLLSRHELSHIDPRYAYPQSTFTNYSVGAGQYGTHPMPPPAYDPNRPPIYEGGAMPLSGNKIDPNQLRHDEEYSAPLGPPPPASLRPERSSGSTSPVADPERR